MLSAQPTVPHVLKGEVPGLDGTHVWLDLPDPRDRLTLWAVGIDRTAAQLDLAALDALLALLGEVRAAMAAGTRGA